MYSTCARGAAARARRRARGVSTQCWRSMEELQPAPEVEPSPSLDVLPDEVLLRVFAAVSVADVGVWRSIGLVSRRWRRVGLHDELPIWTELNSQRFCVRDRCLTPRSLPQALSLRTHLWTVEQAMWGHHADTSGTGITCGTPAFASCHLAPIAARCSHLLKVDLTGIEIGGMLAGTSMPAMVQLVRSSTRLDSFRARDKAPVDCLLVHELASLPLLTSLSLANTDVTDAAFHAAAALSAEGLLCFPSLRRLSVAHCARLAGAGLVAIVQVVLPLQALSVDGCSQLQADTVAKLSGLNVGRSVPISISAILHTTAHGFQPASDRAPGPLGTPPQCLLPKRLCRQLHVAFSCDMNVGASACGATDVSCGICHTVLWRGLLDYCLHDGQQAHIQSELTTNTPPLEYVTASVVAHQACPKSEWACAAKLCTETPL